MINKAILWYANKTGFFRYFIQAIVIFSIFYGGILIKLNLQEFIENNDDYSIIIQAIIIFIVFFIYMLMVRHVDNVLDERDKLENEKKSHLMYAHSQLDNLVSNQISTLKIQINSYKDIRRHVYDINVTNIKDIIKCVYQFFESAYGESEKMEDRIDFEITFMTKSYKDNGITIPAFGNRKGRAPVSMKERLGNKEKYADTVTAQIYNSQTPKMRIISDTNNQKVDYKEIYPGQKNRIRSSIIFPVLDDENNMLGALVAHCNKKDFFLEHDKIFWEELLDIYAIRIALEKAKLDYYSDETIQKEQGIEWNAPF